MVSETGEAMIPKENVAKLASLLLAIITGCQEAILLDPENADGWKKATEYCQKLIDLVTKIQNGGKS